MIQDTMDEESIEGFKQKKVDACVQTISLKELLDQLRRQKKGKTKSYEVTMEDTEFKSAILSDNDASELDLSYDAPQPHQANKNSLDQPLVITTEDQRSNDKVDETVDTSKHSSSSSDSGSTFSLADIPAPVLPVETKKALGVNTESTTLSTNAQIDAAVDIEMKTLQETSLAQQRLIDKLNRRNQELLDGAGAAMTQDDKESLEREVSALRGQVALLQRNNRIFSDRERNELKQDLELANRRCTNYQNQLEALKRSLEFEQVEKLKREIKELKTEAEKLHSEIREYRESADTDDDSNVSSNERQEKYARLLELEDEAEELKTK
uniref:Uncharacterized protein n=1 Tax=Ciona savignyi TaxID=51511 RepID=H2YZK5_CIOSA